MKNLTLLILALLICPQTRVLSQPCLPEGIIFSTQEEIDNFQTNYPNCTEIEGDVEIHGSYITNLNGLNVLTAFGGYLIINSTSLTSLTGLENLTSIYGNLIIGGSIPYGGNISLSSLTGLNNLTSVGGDISIRGNSALTSIAGLENLTSISGSLILGGYYSGNASLISLIGLDNVSSIEGSLFIYDNDALSSLIGLDNVTSVGGSLSISNNDTLTSLAGLDNIDAGSIINLSIGYNTSLSTCDVKSVCDYLVSPNGSVNIHNNATGCNSPTEVANACGNTLPCLPYGNYYFSSQADIDNFQSNYPGCTELEGNIFISGNDITNLSGLSVVTSIGGKLSIMSNDSLISLTGLENLTAIEGRVEIGFCDEQWSHGNPSLTSLTGLDNLTSIGGSLQIMGNNVLTSFTGLDNLTSIGGGIWFAGNNTLPSMSGLDNVTSVAGNLGIVNNDVLTSLMGLDNITTVEGDIAIKYNDALISLTGLDNISAASIEDLTIIYNNSLSTCEVQSLCDYLVSPYGSVNIYNNAPGCNSQEEVEAACEFVSVDELQISDKLLISPNPFSGQTIIEFSLSESELVTLSIYDITGKRLKTILSKKLSKGNHKINWNAEGLIEGVYFIRLETNHTRAGQIVKMIKL